MERFVGIHNFHNFTVQLAPEAQEARREVLSVAVTEEGGAWARVRLLGRSFLLHQIRRMVGLAVAVALARAPADAIADALGTKEKRGISMAPAEGLFLAEVQFVNYTSRCNFVESLPISIAGIEEDVEAWTQTAIRAAVEDLAPSAFGKWLGQPFLYEKTPSKWSRDSAAEDVELVDDAEDAD